MTDVSRRKFIQLTVLGSAVAAAGCDPKALSRYNPRIYKAEVAGQYGGYDNRVLPYVNQPDGYQDGVPQYFATVCQMCPAGCGLFVRTMGGRAHQVQGNPAHPVSGGKVCSRGIGSLQHLYSPDRLRFPARRGERPGQPIVSDWETALTQTAQAVQGARGRVAIITDAVSMDRSPTLMGIVRQFAKVSGASVTSYALLDDAPWRAAAKAVYGRDQLPAYQLDQADYILAFGSDFLEAGPSQVYYNRLFGEFRQGPRRTQGNHGKFVYVGPRMNATAAKADVWLPCNPGTESIVAQALVPKGVINGITDVSGNGSTVLPGVSLAQAAQVSGLTEAQLTQAAQEFAAAGARAVAIGGGSILSQPNATAAMTAIEALNVQVGSKCVSFGTAALPLAANAPSHTRQAQALVKAMQGGRVGALLILGQSNPAFSLPPSFGFADALARVPFVAALTPMLDDTSASANVLMPTRTFMEDWGDDIPAVLPAGATVATLRQPIIDPQFVTDSPGLSPEEYKHDLIPWMDTRPLGDLLIDLARRIGKPLPDADTRTAVRRTWAGLKQANLLASGTDNDPAWIDALGRGGFWKQGAIVPAMGRLPAPSVPSPAPALANGAYALHLFPQTYWQDGRHANLGWSQEIPDPMTMAVWNSWVEINLQEAMRLGIRTGDIVRISGPQGSVEAPAVPTPGLHPQVIAMPIGQGHGDMGRNASGRGTNPLAILAPMVDAQTGSLAYGAAHVRIEKVKSAQSGYNGKETLVLVQDRPGGAEPDAVKDLIHTTAKEWKQAKPVTGAPQAEGSIFHRGGTVENKGYNDPGGD